MGKQGKGKSSGYVHNHTYNAKARESNERKLISIQNIAIRRFQSYVEKIQNNMRSYVPPGQHLKSKMDPSFQLKGAALAAQEFYRPEGYEAPLEARNLLQEYQGRMWEHTEGQQLLRAMLDLGLALHNIGSRSKDAVRTFQETIAMDPEDHLLVRHRLLRCYLDNGDGLSARELLDTMCTGVTAMKKVDAPSKPEKQSKKSKGSSEKMSNESTAAATATATAAFIAPDSIKDKRSCCCYNRAFIEHISLLLDEPGAQEDIRDELLGAAYKMNPFTLWVIAHHAVFKEVLSRTTLLCDKEVLPHVPAHSVEDALVFYEADLPLWQQTDGAVEWIQDYLVEHNLCLPTLTGKTLPRLPDTVNSAVALSAAQNEGIAVTAEDLHEMYVGMFQTAFDIVAEQQA